MSVTPDFIGQIYKDTNNGNLWRANSLTPGDWTLEAQQSELQLSPIATPCGELVGVNTFGSPLPGVTSIVINHVHPQASIDIESTLNVTSIILPNLVDVDLGNVSGGSLLIFDHAALTSVSAPNLVTCRNGVVWNTLSINTNPVLVSISVPSLAPLNGCNLDFSKNALDAATVNAILARCVAAAGFVSGLVDLSGGTNAAPTGQGILDKATLNARQPGLAVTN